LSATVFERVIVIASDVFEIPPKTISATSSPENIDHWDSTQHLHFVLALEEAFQLQLSPEETEKIRTVGDAVKIIDEKLSGAGR
jgi:acyl carrier protein